MVPAEVVLALGDAVSRSSVDDFWSSWSQSAEAGLFSAYSKAGGPTEAGSAAFLGRGLLRIRSRRLGGRVVGGRRSGRLYRVSQGVEVDVHCAQYFVNSSLAPVVLFRRRLRSVSHVFEGTKDNGFTQSRWNALLGLLGGCMSSWSLWSYFFPRSVHPDLHGFYKWVVDALELLNGFLKHVVVSRGDTGIRKWTRWLREDLGSWLYAWLRPDFVPPSPFLVVKDPQTQSSRILVEPHLIDAESVSGIGGSGRI